MLDNWKTHPLEDVVEKIIDYRGKTPQKSSSGIPLITAKVIKDGRINIPDEFIAEDMYDKWMTRGIPQVGDVVLTTEAPLGEVAQIKTRSKIALAQRVIVLRGKEGVLDNNFLRYFLQSPAGQSSLRAKESGTTVTGIKQSELRQIEIYAPDFGEQCRIAAVLSILDDKIELNMQMNQTLEDIAQAIFKRWFVEFQFPGFNGDLVDGLPKGWRIGKVKDLCNVNARTLSAKDEFDVINYIEISEVFRGAINNLSRYRRGTEPSRARRRLSHGDVVLSTVRPDRGAYFLALHPENNLIASTGFAVFTATSVPFSFLFFLLTNPTQLRFYGAAADGGAYPAINPSVIMDMDVVIPSMTTLDLFHLVAENLLERFEENLKEIKTLTKLRDALLPRLMSGNIPVV